MDPAAADAAAAAAAPAAAPASSAAASAAAPKSCGAKKFSFSLKRNAAEGSAASRGGLKKELGSASVGSSSSSRGVRTPGDPQAPTSSSASTSAPLHVFGFEAAEEGEEERKVQQLLSISEGQLQVAGGAANKEEKPFIIPCKTHLPLSAYRLRVFGASNIAPQHLEQQQQQQQQQKQEEEEQQQQTAQEAAATPPPVWGLVEMKRTKERPLNSSPQTAAAAAGKTESAAATAGAAAVKTEPAEPSSSSAAAVAAAVKNEPAEATADSLATGVRTDVKQESGGGAAAAAAAAEGGAAAAAGPGPLLSGNSLLGVVRRKYLLEKQQQQQQQKNATRGTYNRKPLNTPGEPEKELLQRELQVLPDAPSASSAIYKAMPVEAFGAAMLRGMGLQAPAAAAAASAAAAPKRRTYTRAGLGCEQEMERLHKQLKMQKQKEMHQQQTIKHFIPLRANASIHERTNPKP